MKLKLDLSIFSCIILISLSIWLSFSVKKANKKLQDAEKLAITLEQNLVLSKYQTTILQEALQINISKAPASISPGIPLLNTDTLPNTILYLKAHACSPCNMKVIEMIIDAAAQRPNFCIASHTSNQHFLKPVIEKANLTASERVIWLTDKLFENDQSQYDSELLFVDAQGSILGLLPLELLKEKELFESWLAIYHSADDFKSSAK
jgi:hypothetical protein